MISRAATAPLYLGAYGWWDEGEWSASTERDAMDAGEYLVTSKMLRHR
jgi:hypothetical protein